MIEITAVASSLSSGAKNGAAPSDIGKALQELERDIKKLEGALDAFDAGSRKLHLFQKQAGTDQAISVRLESLEVALRGILTGCPAASSNCPDDEKIKELREQLAELDKRISVIAFDENLIDKLLEFSGLIVTIVQAEDADELAEVLANTTSPPGAWSMA